MTIQEPEVVKPKRFNDVKASAPITREKENITPVAVPTMVKPETPVVEQKPDVIKEEKKVEKRENVEKKVQRKNEREKPKFEDTKHEWKPTEHDPETYNPEVTSQTGSLQDSDVTIDTRKLNWQVRSSGYGQVPTPDRTSLQSTSRDSMTSQRKGQVFDHTPAGGDVKIKSQALKWKAKSSGYGVAAPRKKKPRDENGASLPPMVKKVMNGGKSEAKTDDTSEKATVKVSTEI